jgi:hypothetical protein
VISSCPAPDIPEFGRKYRSPWLEMTKSTGIHRPAQIRVKSPIKYFQILRRQVIHPLHLHPKLRLRKHRNPTLRTLPLSSSLFSRPAPHSALHLLTSAPPLPSQSPNSCRNKKKRKGDKPLPFSLSNAHTNTSQNPAHTTPPTAHTASGRMLVKAPYDTVSRGARCRAGSGGVSRGICRLGLGRWRFRGLGGRRSLGGARRGGG